MAKKKSTLDDSKRRVQRLRDIMNWLLDRWETFPDNLYELADGEYLPFDVKKFLWELIREDFVDAVTPFVSWKAVLRQEGVLPDEE